MPNAPKPMSPPYRIFLHALQIMHTLFFYKNYLVSAEARISPNPYPKYILKMIWSKLSFGRFPRSNLSLDVLMKLFL